MFQILFAACLHFSQLFKQMSTYPTQISSPTVGSSPIVSSSNYLYHDEEEDVALVVLHNKSSTHKRPISNTISFLINGKTVSIDNPDPQLLLADYLRQDLKLNGTKKPCGEGGCGGCTIVKKEPQQDVALVEDDKFISINSCLRRLVQCHGDEFFTVEFFSKKQNRGQLSYLNHPDFVNLKEDIPEVIAHNNGTQCKYLVIGN